MIFLFTMEEVVAIPQIHGKIIRVSRLIYLFSRVTNYFYSEKLRCITHQRVAVKKGFRW